MTVPDGSPDPDDLTIEVLGDRIEIRQPLHASNQRPYSWLALRLTRRQAERLVAQLATALARLPHGTHAPQEENA